MNGDFWRRLRLPWRRDVDIESEVDAELGHHLEMRTRELIEQGVDPDEARARASAAFGDVDTTRRRYVNGRTRQLRRRRTRMFGEEWAQDVRLAFRSLRHRPGFSAMAVFVLALGIGAPTTVFTLVDTIFFERPTHVTEPHRLVRLFRSWAPGEGGGSIGAPDFRYYRENATTLSGLAAFSGNAEAAYSIGGGDPSQLTIRAVSDDYFSVLGVDAASGRWFRPDEDATPGTHPVAILSHAFWTRATGGDPDVFDRSITVNGVVFDIVGVAPEGFSGITPIEEATDVWVPLAMYGALNRQDLGAWWQREPDNVERWLSAVGRLADGVTFEAAEANVVALGGALEYEGKDPAEGAMLTRQFLYNPREEASLRSLSRMLVGVVVIVLLVAAANVAVLLLSRATARYREIGIRTALGAGRARLVRQLMTESLMLALVGGAVGIALAFLFSEMASTLLPLPFETTFSPDGWVLASAAGLTLTTALLVGIPPAVHGSGLELRATLHEDAPTVGAGRLRNVLVVAQISLSVVLVAGALLFSRSYWTARGQDFGFEREGILIVGTELRGLGFEAAEGRTFITDAVERLSGLPGVRAVSTSRQVPFDGDWSTVIDAPPGVEGDDAENRITVGLNAVSAGYFDVTGIEIVSGRAIGPQDVDGATPVTVVNETLAARLWPDEPAVGRTIAAANGLTVVGVARDATYYELGETSVTQAYLPVLQRYMSSVHFFVRTDGDPVALASAVQTALREIEPELAFERVTTMDAAVGDVTARYEVTAVLVSLFGLVALVLAAAGLYGVIAFLVSRRTREIGVRMALGADRGMVARQVLGSGLRLAVIGVALGLVGAWSARGFTESLLFGVEAGDPLPLIGACVTLLLVAAVASLGPARQATRVDPLAAMRAD